MERKIGEIFEYHGEWYQCVKSPDGSCKHCDMNFGGKCPIPIKECTESGRSDKSYVIFKKLEKVGEPYRRWLSPSNNIMVQRYRLYVRNVIMPDEPYMYFNAIDNTIEIELKQTKEDMEENYKAEDTLLTRLVGRYVNNLIDYETFEKAVKELYSDREESKPVLKEFDLEAAKAGKPVCTRDGRKARIICFDLKNEEYPIVAAVENDSSETLFSYTTNGEIADGIKSDKDLIMLPEKKEGWININKDAGLFKSKEEAERNCTKDYVPVRVEFEI